MLDMFVKITPPLLDDVEELQLALVRMKQEKKAWKNKCQTLEISYQADLKDNDDLILILESRAVEMMERCHTPNLSYLLLLSFLDFEFHLHRLH